MGDVGRGLEDIWHVKDCLGAGDHAERDRGGEDDVAKIHDAGMGTTTWSLTQAESWPSCSARTAVALMISGGEVSEMNPHRSPRRGLSVEPVFG
jgi:hypothetical protein